MMRYIFFAKIISVYERTVVTSGRKIGNDTVLEEKSLGWFIRIDESSSIGVGPEKPPFNVGDRVKVTYEKVK